jgi:hypothetical protein
MNHLRLKGVALAAVLGLTFGVGCNRPSPPPTPLSVEELPAALEKAFAKAKPEIKDLATQVVASVQARDYSKAFLTIQNLASRPGLTKDQASVTGRATLTVNSLLQAAETKGDKQAAQTLKTYRIDK